MRTNNLKALLAVAMVGGAFVFSSVALAVPTLRISDGVTTVEVADGDKVANGDAFDDGSSLAGAVNFNGSIGGFNLVISTGITKPAVGTETRPTLDLNSIQLTGGAGTLTISFSETGFVGDGSPTVFNSGVGGGTGSATISYDAYVDDGNTLFGQSTQVAEIGPLPASLAVGGPGALDRGVASPTGPYSITQVVTVTHTRLGTSSFNATTTVPEPATLMLLGAGLLGVGAATRRRRAQA